MVTGFLYRMVQLQLMASPLTLLPLSLHKVAETATPSLIPLLTSLTPMVGTAVEEGAVAMDQEEEATKGGLYVI